MAQIFVSTTGDNFTGSGAIGAPYATIQKGLDVAVSGDVVTVRGVRSGGGQGTGVYKEAVRMTTAGVTLTAYFTAGVYETVWLDGDNYTLPAGTSQAGGTNSYGTWYDFNYTGLVAITASNCTVQGLRARYSRGGGFKANGTNAATRISNIVFKDLHSEFCRCFGVNAQYVNNVSADNTNIYECVNYATFYRPTTKGYPGNHNSGFFYQTCSNATWTNSKVFGVWGEGMQLTAVLNCLVKNVEMGSCMSGGFYVHACKDTTLQNCISYYVASSAYGAGQQAKAGFFINREDWSPQWGPELSCDNIKLINCIGIGCERNFSLLGGAGLALFSNIQFLNCVSVNPRKESAGSIAGLFIANQAQLSNITVANCIFDNSGQPASALVSAPSSAEISWHHNAWSSAPPAYASGTGDVVAADLGLVNSGAAVTEGALAVANYKLKADSVCRFAGAVLAAVVDDFFGVVRTDPYSIGFDQAATTGGGGGGGGGGGSSVGIKFGAPQGMISTASGDATLADSAMGGATTKAAIVVASKVTSLTSGRGAVAGGQMSIGFYDGTTQAYLTLRTQDAQATSDIRMVGGMTALAKLIAVGGTGVEFVATGASLGADSLVINKAAVQTISANVMAMLFGGDGCAGQVVAFTGHNVAGSTVDVNFDFLPDAVILLAANHAFDDLPANGGSLSIGMVTAVANQYAFTYSSTHNVSPTTNSVELESGLIARLLSGQTHEVTFYGSSKITVRTNVSNGLRYFVALGLQFSGAQIYLGTQVSKATTGSLLHNVGIDPGGLLMLETLLSSVGTPATNAETNSWGLGVVTKAAERTTAYVDEDAQATTDSETAYGDLAAVLRSVVGTDGLVASRSAMANPGVTLDYTATPGARQMLLLAVQDSGVLLAATSAASSSASGELHRIVSIAGAATGTASASGELDAVLLGLAATSSASGSASAGLELARAFAAEPVVASSSASGELSVVAVVLLAVVATGSASAASEMQVTLGLAGEVAAAGSASGELVVGLEMAGAAEGSATANGQLQLAASDGLTGEVAGASSASGGLVAGIELAATSSANGWASGGLVAEAWLATASSASSTASGELVVGISVGLAGEVAAIGGASGGLVAAVDLAVAATCSANASGELVVLVLVAGAAEGSATATGGLVLAASDGLTGEVAGASSASGELVAVVELATAPGFALAGGVPTGDLAAEAWLAAASSASSTASGELVVGISLGLAGEVAGSGGASGELVAGVELAGASTGGSWVGEAVVGLGLAVALAGAATSSASTTGGLGLAVELAGAATSSASTNVGALLVAVALAGRVRGRGRAGGKLAFRRMYVIGNATGSDGRGEGI